MKKITLDQMEAASDEIAAFNDKGTTENIRLIVDNAWMFVAEKNQFEEMQRRSIRDRLRRIRWRLNDYRFRVIIAIEVLRGNHYCE